MNGNILPRKPSEYKHFYIKKASEKRNLTVDIKPAFSERKSRITSHIAMDPFPRIVRTELQSNDLALSLMKAKSKKRREGFPKIGKAKTREGEVPHILHPDYAKGIRSEFKGNPVLPPPSILQKPITITDYTNLIMASANKPLNSAMAEERSPNSIYMIQNNSYHVPRNRQGDFSDLETKLIVQNPCTIYMQKKRDIVKKRF